MTTYLRTTGLFEIKQPNNAIRFMVTSFANEGTENIIFTLRSSTAVLVGADDASATGGKTIVDEQTLAVPACGTGYWTKVNLPVGLYEIDAKFFDNELKPSADIRDGVITDPGYIRYLLGPDEFVRQFEPGA